MLQILAKCRGLSRRIDGENTGYEELVPTVW